MKSKNITESRLKKVLYKTKSLPRVKLILFAGLFGIAGLVFLTASKAATTIMLKTIEAESMTLPLGGNIITDSTASGGKALALYNEGTTNSQSFTTSSAATSLVVRAKGSQCRGAPQMTVSVDGMQLRVFSVNSTAWTDYSITGNLSPGDHNLAIGFTRDYAKNNCNRSLIIDKSTFYGETITTSGYYGEYWNTGSGSSPAMPQTAPTLTRSDAAIDFNWGVGSPASVINVDHFISRWTKMETFEAATYAFTIMADDGTRVYIDNQLILDKWFDQGPTSYTASKTMTAGSHTIKVEFYENTGGATAKFNYVKTATTPPPTPTAKLQFGLNAQTGGWGNDVGLEQGRAAQTGVKWFREEFTWNRIEPNNNAWNWGTYDKVVGEAAKLNITILPLLLGTPSWAGPTWNTMPADPTEFSQYAAEVIKRYGSTGTFWAANPTIPKYPITMVEVWNEPYLKAFNASGIDFARYANLVKATAQAGRAINPNVKYLLEADYNDELGRNWIGGLYATAPDLNQYFDYVAPHPYSGWWNPTYYTPPNVDWQFRRVENIRQDIAAKGWGDKHFWFTELGVATCPGGQAYDCVSEQQQATYMKTWFDYTIANYPWVDGIIIYSFRAWEADTANKEDWFGIVHPDANATHKPAWDVLHSYATAP